MPLNKFAAWGPEPLARARPPGLGAIMREGLGAIDTTLKAGLPGQTPSTPAPGAATPSATGLRVIWSLGPVRDALLDQGKPTLASTNRQIEAHLNSKSVAEVNDFLKQEYPDLHEPYLLQFAPLQSGVQGFELERRQRLAELVDVELEIMATVEDLRPSPGARRARKQP